MSALVCHSALYARRPDASKLTEFYFFMSLGGCLGGIFAGLLAPQIFNTVLEYPILLVAALFCRPGFAAERKDWVRAAISVVAVIGLLLRHRRRVRSLQLAGHPGLLSVCCRG